MIELFKAIILGAVQGITEFLPISSTGHLILFQHVFGLSQEQYGLTFDAALHIGTLFAVLWFFRKDWSKFFFVILNAVKNLAGRKNRSFHSLDPSALPQDDKLVILLLLGTIPAVILGVLLEDIVDTTFRSPILVGVMLILFSFVLWYVEKAAQKTKEITKLQFLDSLIIGTAQAIALIPGVSRSGITMASGMWRGLKREAAARFAFLLSAPIVAGAGGKKLLDVTELFLSGTFSAFDLLFFAVGIASAMIFGYLTIKYFLRYISTHSLMVFIWYRIIVGVIIIGAYLL